MHENSKNNQGPVVRWFTLLSCPVLVVIAIVVAFPRLIGSEDEPAYALAVAILSSAVVSGISIYARGTKSRPGKHR